MNKSESESSKTGEASPKETLAALLKQHLTIEVTPSNWTDPNSRIVVVKFDNKKICEATFDVTQKAEYEG